MRINRAGCLRLVAIAVLTFSIPSWVFGQKGESSAEIMNWNEAEQTAWINAYLAAGAPSGDGGDTLAILVLNRGSVALPLLEKKIEEILKSESPRDLFIDKSVDPKWVVGVAAGMIAYAGNEQALREESKLIRIDEHRFGPLIGETLYHAKTSRNPFPLVYSGFQMGNPALEKRIVGWVEELFGFNDDNPRTMRLWSEALVEKYDGEPTATQWFNDPIVSRLKAAGDAKLYDEMRHYTAEAAKKRIKK